MDKQKESCYFAKFSITSFVLLAFGLVTQIMSELMGYTPMLADYFLYLLPSVAAGFFWYWSGLMTGGLSVRKHVGSVCVRTVDGRFR